MSCIEEILGLFPKAALIACGFVVVGAIPLNFYSARLAEQCPPNIDTNGGLWEFGPDYVKFCVINRIKAPELQPTVTLENYEYWSRVVAGNIRGGVPGYKRGDPAPSPLPVYTR